MTTIGELKLYDTKEVSQLLNIGYDTVLKHISTGLIKSRKLGKKHFIPESALKEYFAA